MENITVLVYLFIFCLQKYNILYNYIILGKEFSFVSLSTLTFRIFGACKQRQQELKETFFINVYFTFLSKNSFYKYRVFLENIILSHMHNIIHKSIGI